MLSASKPKKTEAYGILKEAAEMGSEKAKIAVAWAQLFGSALAQDISAANATFRELAEKGNAEAHMVSIPTCIIDV